MAITIQFELASISKAEAAGLMAMLNNFHGAVTMTPAVENTTNSPSATAYTLEVTPEEKVEQGLETEGGASVAQPQAQVITVEAEKVVVPEHAAPEKPRRGRPSKQAAQPNTTQPKEVAPEPVDPTSAPTPQAKQNAPVAPAPQNSPKTVDILRSALKDYTSRHDVQAGIDLLKDFGCNRVSEVAELSADEQDNFIKLCETA